MAYRLRRRKDEGGSAAPLVLGLTLLLVFACGITVDLSGALFVRESLANDLAAAKDAASAPHNTLVMKNSDSAGDEIAETVARSLRANGSEDEIEIWVCEAPASDVPAGKRAIAWGAQVSKPYDTYFARAVGIESVDVGCSIAATAIPYSSGNAWRPSSSSLGGKYTIPAAADADDWAYRQIDVKSEFPAEVQEKLEEAVNRANE